MQAEDALKEDLVGGGQVDGVLADLNANNIEIRSAAVETATNPGTPHQNAARIHPGSTGRMQNI